MNLESIECVRVRLPKILYLTIDQLESLLPKEKIFYPLPPKPKPSAYDCRFSKTGVLELSPPNNKYIYRYGIYKGLPSLIVDSNNKVESIETARALAKTAISLGCQSILIDKEMIKFLKCI